MAHSLLSKELIMPADNQSKLDDRLASLSRRIGERVRQLKENGRFSDEFERVAADIQARQTHLNARVSAAIDSGESWDVIKTELERDYSSLFDNVTHFEQQIEADFAKSSGR